MNEIKIGDQFDNWKVLETNIYNPASKNKQYKDRPCWNKCICTKCNETIRLFPTNDLKNKRYSRMCKVCSQKESRIINRDLIWRKGR